MVFNGGFETHGILLRFLNPQYVTKVFKPTLFYGGFKLCYLTEVFKPMVFYGGS